MNDSLNRRTFLLALASVPLCRVGSSLAAEKVEKRNESLAKTRFKELEQEFGGRLGVFALDTGNGARLGFRAGERFPLCSTFKVLAASAILQRSARVPGLLQQRVKYRPDQLVDYSPITEKHLAQGLTVNQLCAAALQYSDNTAGNLLMRILGGPHAVTAFSRSIGDSEFRLDRWETALNTCIPGDLRDTSTPQAMGLSVQRLVLGNALSAQNRAQLRNWLLGNTTGADRIKAAIPATWKIGDKTGSGDYGTANDVAVVWPPQQKPVVLAIYTTRSQKDSKYRNDVVAAAARVVVNWWKTADRM